MPFLFNEFLKPYGINAHFLWQSMDLAAAALRGGGGGGGGGSMQNNHLLAVPFHVSHTVVLMLEMLVRLFHCLCCSWKVKLISCSTDGAANMTGRLSGVVTRLSAVSLPGFIQIWCELHQINLMQKPLQKNRLWRLLKNSDQFYWASSPAKFSHR